MAKTLLDGVNEVLKKLSLIQSDNVTLSSLTDSARQIWIDQSVQAWNEVMEQMYYVAREPMPNILAENTITLVTSDRDYALQTDLVELVIGEYNSVMLDETNGRFIYHRSYMQIVSEQFQPANWTGIPLYGGIRPTDGEFYLDRIPTSAENGLVYKYRYLKDASVSGATDQFPFSDAVFRALVPAVAEVVNRKRNSEFDSGLYNANLGRAGGLLNKVQERRSWSPRG